MVDNCILDESGQAAFRLNADSIKVFISNTLVNRVGEFNDPSNGRFLDNRGHPIDSLRVTNCIVYNVTQRFYRNGSGSHLSHAQFDQNTFFASAHNGFDFSPADELIFTNNIVANPVFVGDVGSPTYAMTIDTFRDGDYIDISYNNFFTNPEFDAALPAVSMNTGDTVDL